jgi:hypothetical protein
VVTTTLCIVYLTTLVFGTFMKLVQTILMPPEQEAHHDDKSEKTEYEEIMHPNEEEKHEADRKASEWNSALDSRGTPMPWSFATSGTVGWFLRVDESHIKPFLIRNYDQYRIELEDKYQDLLKMNFNVDDNLSQRVEDLLETQSAMGRADSFNMDPNDPGSLMIPGQNKRGHPRTQSAINMPRT